MESGDDKRAGVPLSSPSFMREEIPKDFSEQKKIVLKNGLKLKYKNYKTLLREVPEVTRRENFPLPESLKKCTERVHLILEGGCFDPRCVAVCYKIGWFGGLVFKKLHYMRYCPTREYSGVLRKIISYKNSKK